MAIETVEDLQQHLQWAVELEHSTLPPYLTALYSIKDGTNPEAVEIIHSVFIEEMLHLTLAANILNAVGGAPNLDYPGILPSFPTYLPHSDDAFQVGAHEVLEGGARALPPDRAPGRARRAARGRQLRDDRPVLRGDRGGAEAARRPSSARTRSSAATRRGRSPTPSTTAAAGGSSPSPTSPSALAALEEIVEQGEGLQHQEIWDGDRDMFHPERDEVAHYFRFNELYVGRRYALGDTPQSGPTGEPVAVDWDGVHNMRPNPRTADYPDGSPIRAQLEEFNHAYYGRPPPAARVLQRQPAAARGRDRR